MPRRQRRVGQAGLQPRVLFGSGVDSGEFDEPETTGRFIVILKPGATEQIAAVRSTLSNIAGINAFATSSDYDSGAVSAEDLTSAPGVHFERLGIIIVAGEEPMAALGASTADVDSPILAIEPEYVAYPTGLDDLRGTEYLRGYRDAVNHLHDKLTGGESVSGDEANTLAGFSDTSQATWGLQASRVTTSRFSGQGVRIAVLDTGFDLTHPDFMGRLVGQATFSGFPVQDIHGHGTHCIGTACGPRQPVSGVRRYGIAYDAQIFVGKVFNHDQPRPSAPTGNVIAGIEWAVAQGCRVVSLSIGIKIDQKVQQYEQPIRRALALGTLVVAAAGNNANRPPFAGFVEPPANADASMAVAAIDSQLGIARFSSRSSQFTGMGGIVNIAAPGVAVFSSFPVVLGRHVFLDGTSMATPHVAGIAALWAQATGESGAALWSRLQQSAMPLSLSSADVGVGLAQAPQ